MATFWEFYNEVFVHEHTHPISVLLHVIGSFGSLVILTGVLSGKMKLKYLILFLILAAVPGLIGHKLYESNEVIGDIRFLREDFPLQWFLYGNYVMTWQYLTGTYHHIIYNK